MSNKHFLLIDDDKYALWLMERILLTTSLASRVDAAPNGKIALDMLHHYHLLGKPFPDVIIVDLHMPVLDGLEFIATFQKIKYIGKNKTLVVVLTSSSDPEDFKKVRRLGISHVISKPISEEKILKALEKELGVK